MSMLSQKISTYRVGTENLFSVAYRHLLVPTLAMYRRLCKRKTLPIYRYLTTSVSDPDSFFTDPDTEFLPPIRIQIQEKKTNFFKGKNKILGETFVFNPKRRFFIFVFNQQVGRYFTGIKQRTFFVIIFKNK